MNALICEPKASNISGISEAIFPARHQQKSSQHERARAACDGAICSKSRKIVPYHRDSPNTRNGARLRSPSPIMAPGVKWHDSLTLSRTVLSPDNIWRGIQRIVTSSIPTSADCADKQLTQERQSFLHVCSFWKSTKCWQSYWKNKCSIIDAK